MKKTILFLPLIFFVNILFSQIIVIGITPDANNQITCAGGLATYDILTDATSSFQYSRAVRLDTN